MDSVKYIGMDVHKESISIAVMNSAGKIVMECVIETKASVILELIHGLRGDLQVTFEEGTSGLAIDCPMRVALANDADIWITFTAWRNRNVKNTPAQASAVYVNSVQK